MRSQRPVGTVISSPRMQRPMRFATRSVSVIAALMVAALSSAAIAQSLDDQGPRERLRQRYGKTRGGSTDNTDAIRMLRSDKPEERLQGVLTLAGSDDPNSVTHLLSAAADSDLRVRIKAIDELGNRRASEATPVLVQQLFLRETTPVVHQRVLAALGKIGDTVATRPICEFLSRDLDQSTRGSAIFALGEIGDDAALDVLSKVIARGDPTTSRLADEAVRKIRHQSQAPVEIPAFSEDRAR